MIKQIIPVKCKNLSEERQRRLLTFAGTPKAVAFETLGDLAAISTFVQGEIKSLHPYGEHGMCVHAFGCCYKFLLSGPTTKPRLSCVWLAEEDYERWRKGETGSASPLPTESVERVESYELPCERGYYKAADGSVFYTRNGDAFQLVMTPQGVLCDPGSVPWVNRGETDRASRTLNRFPFKQVRPDFVEVD